MGTIQTHTTVRIQDMTRQRKGQTRATRLSLEVTTRHWWPQRPDKVWRTARCYTLMLYDYGSGMHAWFLDDEYGLNQYGAYKHDSAADASGILVQQALSRLAHRQAEQHG